MALLRLLIGLGTVSALGESLLPQGGVFRTVRIGIGLVYLGAICSQIVVILSELGG